MSLSSSTTAHPHDRRHSDYLGMLATSEHMVGGSPLSHDNLAHNVHHASARSANSIGHQLEGAIPSWIFNTGSSAMPYDSDSISPLVPSSAYTHDDSRHSHAVSRSYQPQQIPLANGSNHLFSQSLQHVPSVRHSSSSDLDFYSMGQPVPKTEAPFATSLLPIADQAPDSKDAVASTSSRASAKTSSSPDSALQPYGDSQSHSQNKIAFAMSTHDPVDSWMASNGLVTGAERHKSEKASGRSQREGSQTGDLTFKTSADRRERNKASQRESRKRKQTRLETLEDENAALRKALSRIKQEGDRPGSNLASQSNGDPDATSGVKISGAIHLEGIESHLEDDSAEAEWSDIAGHFFQGRLPSEPHADTDSSASSSTSVFESRVEQMEDGAHPKSLKNNHKLPRSKKASDPRVSAKDSTWELSLNRMRQQEVRRFPSMVVVPELMLYKVCRLYFSIVLPFTSGLKSGLVNLRVARAASGYMGGCDDLPRFSGYPSVDPSADFVLPKNLMPTEAQLRIGFHPVEIAVVPSPAMRDKLLTVLSAFQSIDNLVQDSDLSSDDEEPVTKTFSNRMALIADTAQWADGDKDIVRPDKSRIYSYGFTDKPKGSHRLKLPAQQWLNTFFVDLVQNLRVWSPSGDIFDPECFEYHEPFFRKYPFMVDEQVMRSTNRWRRARGEAPIRL